MCGKRVRLFVISDEILDIFEVAFHPILKALLGIANVNFACFQTSDFLNKASFKTLTVITTVTIFIFCFVTVTVFFVMKIKRKDIFHCV